MDTNWDDLKYLLAVAKHSTLLAAAEALSSNPSTVSRRIKRLEGELGVPLIERQGDGWRPTTEAEQFLKIADKFHSEINAAENEVIDRGAGLRGSVTLSGFPFVNEFALVPALGRFIEMFPELSLEIEYAPKAHSLALGEADLAIRLNEPTEGKLIKRKLIHVQLGIYQRRGAPPSQNWAGLVHQYDDQPAMHLGFREFGRAPTVRCNSLGVLAQAAATTDLPAPLSSCIARQHPELEPIIPPERFVKRAFWLVYHESKRNDPKVMNTIAWLDEVFPSPNHCVCGKCF